MLTQSYSDTEISLDHGVYITELLNKLGSWYITKLLTKLGSWYITEILNKLGS